MKNVFTLVLFVSITVGAMAQTPGLPTNPEPGKCYVKCIIPDEFGTETVRVLVTPEYRRLSVVPATYKTVEEQVLVKEATKEYIYHPAVYKTETISYVGKAKEPTLSVIAATFSPSSQRIETYPKTARWEYIPDAECVNTKAEDCDILCYKEYPAQNQTVPTQVLDADARSEAGENPEIVETYTKQVIAEAAYVEEVPIEPVYRTITKRVIDQPARIESETVPAVYKDVTKTVLVKKGGVTVYEEIDCGLVRPNILPIYWDFNSAVLNADAQDVVDEYVYSLMVDKPNISVELSSHTDSRGSDEYNRSLSQRRADAIKNYLIQKGIASSRLVSKGFGETRLQNNCGNGVDCTEEQHQQNRRTEYRVLQN